jgi:hypothetical protein
MGWSAAANLVDREAVEDQAAQVLFNVGEPSRQVFELALVRANLILEIDERGR